MQREEAMEKARAAEAAGAIAAPVVILPAPGGEDEATFGVAVAWILNGRLRAPRVYVDAEGIPPVYPEPASGHGQAHAEYRTSQVLARRLARLMCQLGHRARLVKFLEAGAPAATAYAVVLQDGAPADAFGLLVTPEELLATAIEDTL